MVSVDIKDLLSLFRLNLLQNNKTVTLLNENKESVDLNGSSF